MEDVHHCVTSITDELETHDVKWCPHSWFAVFDGHAGIEAAEFARANLLKEVVASPAYNRGDFAEALVEGFRVTDDAFNKVCQRERQAGSFGYRSGCTAVTALIAGQRLVVGNLGDSRAVMCVNKKAVDMSVDHKPIRPDEVARIEQAGGRVIFNRVNGVLGVSRALGDYDFKEANLGLLISNVPEVKEATLDDGAEFLILACDGLWDVVSSADAVKNVSEWLAGGKSPQEAVRLLVEFALGKDTTDNVSAVLVTF